MNQRIALYVIAVLAGIGVIVTLPSNPWSVLIPVIVAGVILLLWKFPPNRWNRANRSGGKRGASRGFSQGFSRGSGRLSPRGSNRRTNRANLRVIPGNRKDEDDNPPAYH